ncbi:MAG: DUF2497 domain-containing protein [Rhodospirillaceae bacterium]|nr:DUF2497 domain-containing protein [Rhodospirillaceae bacterium]
MEEILASIRRIISEDSQNGGAERPADPAASAGREHLAPLRAQPPSTDPRIVDEAPAPRVTRYDEPVYGGYDEAPPDAVPGADPAETPFDLTDTVPGNAAGSERLTNSYASDLVLDLTNEVRDSESVMDLHRAVDPEPDHRETSAVGPAPPPRLTVAEIGQRVSAAPAPIGETSLVSSRAEAATASALSRLREATERRHEPPPVAVSDEQIETMIRQRIDPALDERLTPLLRERIDALLVERLDPTLRERLDTNLHDRVGPLLDERLDPALREQLNATLQRRIEPLLEERLAPALRERLEPILRERLDPILRERLDPMLRDWFDRNLPDIVERVVAREIERLVRQPGGS